MISKSRNLLGRQCSRRLWLAIAGEPEPSVDPDDVLEAGETEAEAVEAIAAELFEGAARIASAPVDDEETDLPVDGAARSEATAAALDAGKPVLQAHFAVDDLITVSDVVEPRDDGVCVWEVKSSVAPEDGRTKPLFDWDLAFQWHVVEATGRNVLGAGLLLLDRTFVRGDGAPAAEGLIQRVDRTPEVSVRLAEVRTELDAMRRSLASKSVPEEAPRARCKGSRAAAAGNRPSTCGHLDLTGFCGRDLPDDWARQLPGLSGARSDFVDATPGLRIADLDPDDAGLGWTANQQRVIRAVRSGEPQIDANALRLQLDDIRWPVAYVDFEFDPMQAIPKFEGAWPYARLPFQWALRVEPAPGAGLQEAVGFLHLEDSDPRRPFAESLLEALPTDGSIVAHNRSAETTVLNQLARSLGDPMAASLTRLVPRFVDTLVIAKSGYYHTDQKGSYSIKKLAPVLLGRGYEGLAIDNGLLAVTEWRRAIAPGTDADERDRIRAALLEYCGLDAELMHGILEELRRIARWTSA